MDTYELVLSFFTIAKVLLQDHCPTIGIIMIIIFSSLFFLLLLTKLFFLLCVLDFSSFHSTKYAMSLAVNAKIWETKSFPLLLHIFFSCSHSHEKIIDINWRSWSNICSVHIPIHHTSTAGVACYSTWLLLSVSIFFFFP